MGNDAPAGARPAYPVSLNVAGRRVIVVGGGTVAERRVRGLLDSGAEIHVIAPRVHPAIETLASEGRLSVSRRAFIDGDLDGAFVAVVATDDAAANLRAVAAARARGVLVNDATDGAHGDFTTPLVHRSGPVTFAVDTGGASPSFARRVIRELEERFGFVYGRAAETLARVRPYVLNLVPPAERAPVMGSLAARPIDELATLNPLQAEHLVDETVARLRGTSDEFTAGALVCATRASALAMTQARLVTAKLAARGTASTLEQVATTGDRVQDRSLAAIGADGVFVKELEAALRDRRADYAVHSCKDLPGTLPADMQLAAVSERADPRDAFCSEKYATFAALPNGARVGTSSPRRRAQLRALRDDLEYDDIRGNVDTRLRKLHDGEFDAIIVACAGLERLGSRAPHTMPFDPADVVPAVAQGALGIECRADDPVTAAILRRTLNDEAAELCVHAERAYLATLRGGCQAPAGAYARPAGNGLEMVAVVAAPDGERIVRATRTAAFTSADHAERLNEAATLGTALAHEVLAGGGDAILAALVDTAPLGGRLFLLPRTQERASRIAPALRSAGAVVIEAGSSSEAAAALGDRIPDGILFPSSGSVDAITGYLRALRENGQRPVVAAMGPGSASAAGACGFEPDVVAPQADVASFVQAVTGYVLRMEQR